VLEASYVAVYHHGSNAIALNATLTMMIPVTLPAAIASINPFTLWRIGLVAVGVGTVHRVGALRFGVPLWTVYIAFIAISSVMPAANFSAFIHGPSEPDEAGWPTAPV
jgi:hypothetical protein